MDPNNTPQRMEPVSPGPVSRSSNSLGLVTRAMCQARARQLAVIAGRPSHQVWQADYLQAKRELTGETDPDLQDAILDAAPPAGDWDPVSGVTWQQPLSATPKEKTGPGFSSQSPRT